MSSVSDAPDLQSGYSPQADTTNKRKRVRKFTPSDRAQHRILEKKRREDFNDRMLELAQLLPGISAEQNLTKHIIVNESIRQLRAERETRNTLLSTVKALMLERDTCLQELKQQDKLRAPRRVFERIPAFINPIVRDMIRDEHVPIPSFHGTLGYGDNLDEIEHEDQDENIRFTMGFHAPDPTWDPSDSAGICTVEGAQRFTQMIPSSHSESTNSTTSQEPPIQLLQKSADLLSLADPAYALLPDDASHPLPTPDIPAWWSAADDLVVLSPGDPLSGLTQVDFPWQIDNTPPLNKPFIIHESQSHSHSYHDVHNIWNMEHAGYEAQCNF